MTKSNRYTKSSKVQIANNCYRKLLHISHLYNNDKPRNPILPCSGNNHVEKKRDFALQIIITVSVF